MSTQSWLVSYPISVCKEPFQGSDNQFKYFSTKQLANEYVVQNNPKLSVNDVMDFFRNYFEETNNMHPSHGTIKSALTKLVKQKLNTIK